MCNMLCALATVDLVAWRSRDVLQQASSCLVRDGNGPTDMLDLRQQFKYRPEETHKNGNNETCAVQYYLLDFLLRPQLRQNAIPGATVQCISIFSTTACPHTFAQARAPPNGDAIIDSTYSATEGGTNGYQGNSKKTTTHVNTTRGSKEDCTRVLVR